MPGNRKYSAHQQSKLPMAILSQLGTLNHYIAAIFALAPFHGTNANAKVKILMSFMLTSAVPGEINFNRYLVPRKYTPLRFSLAYSGPLRWRVEGLVKCLHVSRATHNTS